MLLLSIHHTSIYDKVRIIIYSYIITVLTIIICDRISENGSKSHIFISLYLLLLHGHYYIFYIILYHYMEFNAQIIKTIK